MVLLPGLGRALGVHCGGHGGAEGTRIRLYFQVILKVDQDFQAFIGRLIFY